MTHATAFVLRWPAHYPCDAGVLVISPAVILNVTSFTRSHWRGIFFEMELLDRNSLENSAACGAVFGVTRLVRYPGIGFLCP